MVALPDAITVLELNQRLSDAVALARNVHNVWVVGETSDLRVSNGHCYMELVDKDDRGNNVSRIRAIVWASNFRQLAANFSAVTGMTLASGIRIRVRLSVSYHPNYGMSAVISEIDPSYTAGDALRRRAEILQRLADEKVAELNRNLKWPLVANRIAVISAKGAAGYGDFINQLFNNPYRLRFSVRLFEAVMQGDRTVPSILQAMAEIEKAGDSFDAVVIIRGGGSTTDLSAFDSYELGRAVAGASLPVVVGIGHERDVTVLDYIANQSVKTPTAAAELLIDRVARVLEAVGRAADRIYQAAADMIADNRELLAHASATLPGLAIQNIMKRRNALERASLTITTAGATKVTAANERLNRMEAEVTTSVRHTLQRQADKLAKYGQLLDVLSPQAVLSRGFSLTLGPDGKAIRKASEAPAGTQIKTLLGEGSITSTVIENQ